ncbi:hypothetical protein QVD99_002883 [Batrachochytrium dendrobatidis]|nr:hypothetical protein QVD99_002883 [Batrachochytrium dendrobatidis]
MKFSIAVLSSILAVCSVTIANPTDPSSTVSAEASTSTASSSAPGYSDLYVIYNEILEYCYPLDLGGIVMIETLAKTEVEFGKAKKLFEEKHGECKAQKTLVRELEQKYASLHEAPDQESKTAEIKAQREILDNCEDDLEHLKKNRIIKDEQIYMLKQMLKKYLAKRFSAGPLLDEDMSPANQYPPFLKCYSFFHHRLSQ